MSGLIIYILISGNSVNIKQIEGINNDLSRISRADTRAEELLHIYASTRFINIDALSQIKKSADASVVTLKRRAPEALEAHALSIESSVSLQSEYIDDFISVYTMGSVDPEFLSEKIYELTHCGTFEGIDEFRSAYSNYITSISERSENKRTAAVVIVFMLLVYSLYNVKRSDTEGRKAEEANVRLTAAKEELKADLVDAELASVQFNNCMEGIIITDKDGKVKAANPAALTMVDHHPADHWMEFFEGAFHGDEQIELSVRKHGIWEGRLSFCNHSGSSFTVWMRVVAFCFDGEITNQVITFSDISDNVKQENKLFYMAHYDALTRIPNRNMFYELLGREILSSRRNNKGFAVIFFDLDKFKQVNDTMGHDVGDQLLRMTAERAREALRDSDVVARLGGDEFVVILPGVNSKEILDTVTQKLIGSITRNAKVAGYDFPVMTSVGSSLYPEHGLDADSLIKNADKAMYFSKESGHNISTIYSPGLY